MSSHAKSWASHRAAPRKSRFGGIEISTLAKWLILLAFMILILIVLIKVRTGGEENLSSLCERTGGLMGC